MDLKTVLPLLRQNFAMELDVTIDRDPASILGAYDRAVATTLLSAISGEVAPKPKLVYSGPKPGSKEAKDRAARAAESRRRNRERAEQAERESAERSERIANAANGGESTRG